MTHYTTLGIPKTAVHDAIRHAYHALARKYHPDHNAGDKVAEEKFKAVAIAYGVLSDPKQRGGRVDSTARAPSC